MCNFNLLLLIILLKLINLINSSLLIGAIFSISNNSNENLNHTSGSSTLESEEEIVFKHAVYISNQLSTTTNYPTLLHKIIHVSNNGQLKTIKKICKETQGNMLALIGPNNDDIYKYYTRSLCEKLDLVHFDIEPSLQSSYSINLHPALDVLCQSFVDLIKKFEWKHVAIIYDSKTNLKKINCLLNGGDNSQDEESSIPKLDLTLRIANNEQEYRTILRDISRRMIKNIILDLEPDEAQQMLKMALQLGMINSTFNYILTTLDIQIMNLEDFKYNRANITGLRLIKTDSPLHKTISLNLTDYFFNSLKDSDKILNKTKNALFFDSIYTFATAIKKAENSLHLVDGNVSCSDSRFLSYGKKLSSFIENVNITGLTGTINFQNRQRREFDLDVLQLKESGLFKSGTWSSKQGLNYTYYDEFIQDSVFFTKKNNFRVVTLVEEPYVIEKDGKLQGFCIDILDEIANKMNFKYELYKVPDNQYGTDDENGTWNGMIRELMDKKADLAISALTINFKRQQKVDFTKPFLSLGISILYKMPTSKKPGLFSFLNPLSLEIWIFTLITYILVSIIMMVLARFSPYEWRSTHSCDQNNEIVENQFTLWNSLWFAVGTLMQQGSDINPKALSTRLVGGVWWFFTLIIISSYTANLAAFLTVEKVDISITNVEDLANQSKVRYGVFEGGSTMNFFKESKIETYKRMWRVMQKNPDLSFVKSNQEGVDRVKLQDYAYLMESPLIDYEIQRHCNLTQIGGLLDSKGYGIATQLGSPYTDDISLKILEMQEKGEIQKFYNRWWKGGNTCIRDEKKDSKANALKVENVGGIFVVLIGGCFLAVFVSLCEFLYYAKRNSKKINKPICTQMCDELKFAVRCGGSAKKVQLTDSTAVTIKKEKKLEKNSSLPLNLVRGNLVKKDCKKCEEIIHNELLDNITSRNALVCKHDSCSNLSIMNPGLLIVEKELALDAQKALLNSHVKPHSHLHMSHHRAKKVYLEEALGKKAKKKALNRTVLRPKYDFDDNSDYILMDLNSNKRVLKKQKSLNEEQFQEIPIMIDSGNKFLKKSRSLVRN